MNNCMFKYDSYFVYEELANALKKLAGKFTDFCHLSSIGKSYEGRDVWCLTITNFTTGSSELKPAMYIDGNTHAGEVTGSMAALYTADYLLTHYDVEQKVKLLLDNYTFYIIPRVNPDGAELYLTSPYMLRSSVKIWPDKNISNLPGLYESDIDNNGYLLNMRVRDDKRGEWKVSKLDPRIMEPRRLDDLTGEYYHLYPEGLIKNYTKEPFNIKERPWRIDLNRNFPSEWNPQIKGGGDYPASEPEVKNIVDFILSHKNIGALEALHTSGGILFRSPYIYSEDQMDQDDLLLLKTIGQRGFEITGYPDVPSTGGIFAATIVDWAYEQCGIPGFTPELWDLYGRAGIKIDRSKRGRLTSKEMIDRELKLLTWNDRELAGEGFFNWKRYNHPQLGEVEVGGWNPKYVRQNPPAKFLQQECYKMSQFLLAHSLALPRVVIEDVEIEKIENNIVKLSILVGNHGFLATNLSNKGKKIKKIAEDKIIMDIVHNAELLSGKSEVKIGFLKGYFMGRNLRNKNEKSCARVEYLLRCGVEAKVKITVVSEKGGTTSQEVSF